ncbi:uncharacterized protein MELLADRAFT_62621 [Melampsora larici-populina 98AG31]|uniref:Uncharacterized protein n=1 Tax=Melampsora larici-populina (strain 98AG31 / pathotype 3-4-7) TaxID=747676 RepID=F4RJK7_MELLP|nr:uncharacterized protein MELLADRAFT_62621 [Melampsora larici-populina 98AG31]EGG07325.1 hypothetical protein MELLADRAFT_62621 [Melampsora larici-populina 98AG31]
MCLILLGHFDQDLYLPLGVQIPLQDLRKLQKEPDLKTQGFTYVLREFPSDALHLDAFSDGYTKLLERDAIALVKELKKKANLLARLRTNSHLAFCVSRGHRGKDPTTASEKPTRGIHSDMSSIGAKFIKENFITTRLKALNDAKANEFLEEMRQGNHVVILNVWRPIQQVERDPLAICDWTTVSDEDHLDFGHHPMEADNAIQAWSYNKKQSWYYLPQQQPNEVFVFVQHDSAAPDGHGMNVPHASPVLLGTPEDTDHRLSYDFRIAAIVGPEFELVHNSKSKNKRKRESKVRSFFEITKSIFRNPMRRKNPDII